MMIIIPNSLNLTIKLDSKKKSHLLYNTIISIELEYMNDESKLNLIERTSTLLEQDVNKVVTKLTR